MPCDFSFYNELSSQMFTILRKWTPDVEVYSVDEAFLDIKGFRQLYHMNYRQIAHAIKEDIKKNLGFTVSMGVSVTKTLAKMAAELNKPDGVTVISSLDINRYLPRFQVSDVPGFGRNIVPLLHKFGVKTCEDFVNLTEGTVRNLLHRPGLALWHELQGEQVFKIEKTFAPNKIITRTSSFEPLTNDQRFLWSHTLRQLERAIEALHHDHQLVKEIGLYLRDKEFRRYHWTYRLPTATKSFPLLIDALKQLWQKHFPRGHVFRSTGIIFTQLLSDTGIQLSLFEDPGLIIRKDELERSKQAIKDRFGNLAIRSASSLRLKELKPQKTKPLKAKAFHVEW